MLWIWVLIKESFILAMVFLTGFLSNFRIEWRNKTEEIKTPILLVHGYLNFSSIWLYFGKRLFKSTGRSIYTINLGNPFHSIEDYAKKLQKKALEIEKIEKTEKLILVAHSMGGVVSLFYALHLAKKGSIQKLITLGSPLRGTKLARIGIGKCISQINIGSKFLKELLESFEKDTELSMFHVATKKDGIVIPYTSCFLDKRPSHHYLLDNIGHVQMTFSNKIIKKVDYWITSKVSLSR